MPYHFDGIIKTENFNCDNILIDEESYENILVCSISYKRLIDTKSLCIRFDKIDRFIRVYDGTRYLALFETEKCGFICNRITCLIRLKSGITYVISHNYAHIKVNLYDLYDTIIYTIGLIFHNALNKQWLFIMY